MKSTPVMTAQQSKYCEGLCFQPMAQRFDFSKAKGERDVVKAYKGQLGKTKHHKFTTFLKVR